MYLFELQFSLGIRPEVGLLDHTISQFLVLKGTSILLSIVVVPIYIPINRVGGFPFLHTLSSVYGLETL